MSINLLNAKSIIGRTVVDTKTIDKQTSIAVLTGPPSGVIKVQSLNVYSLLLRRPLNDPLSRRTFVDFIVDGKRLNSEVGNNFTLISEKLKFSFINKNEPMYLTQGQTIDIIIRGDGNAFQRMEISYSCTYEEITL
jgi:hypothetical protein